MKKLATILLLMCLSASLMQAQITIGGNVYGGGNAGNLGGRTTVTICAGDIHEVFGGARQADVGGSAFVHIDGEHACDSSYIIIDKLYGGNDIAGTIGTSSTLPTELKKAAENKVNATWNAFVRLSTKMTTNAQSLVIRDSTQKTYIGQLFAGGNGDYTYSNKKDNDKYDVTIGDKTITDILKPEVGRTYLEICGGSIVYAYGGGNNVTVTDSTVIYMRNPSKVVNSIVDASNPHAGTGGELLTDARFKDDMGINTSFSYPGSAAYQMGRLFGGNNKAPMAIRPKWNLKVGQVRNIYSGGNQGPMTHPKGILLTIASDSVETDNVFGGCRMADVNPAKVPIGEEYIDGVRYPAGYSARLYLTGGNINNVYGGNDISGNIYGGNAVGIHCNINKDVYGGGNGSYPYTDNPELIGDDIYGDLYYNPAGYASSVEALNAFRPNAESVSIRISGKVHDEVTDTIYIGGAVYCGGNSATLRNDTPGQNAAAELKIGSYVYADKVFLGNNGENMVKTDVGDGANGGVLYTMSRTDLTTEGKFNSINLLDSANFSNYMAGVALDLMPRVVFDSKANNDPQDYEPYSTYIGSIYCGGNVGSLTKPGKISVDIKEKIIVFEKIVGGCNNAFVDATAYNALYKGGVFAETDAENIDKLELSFSGVKIQPKRWKNPEDKKEGLVWNTISAATQEKVDFDPATAAIGESSPADIDRRFIGGNIYGGCYNSGIVKGNVILNVNESINDLEGDFALFDVVKEDSLGEAKLNEHDSYTITQRRSGVIRAEQGMDVLGAALNLFGGGYGERAEIWGSVTINVNKGYIFQIFGGGERGAIGKGKWNTVTNQYDYPYDPKYSTVINMKGTIPGVHKGMEGDSPDMAESEFVYGGSFMGPISGNTKINLGNCRIFDSFAGSCNADISGHTETYVGVDGGFPWVRDNVYGGNDLGGRVLGGTAAAKEDKNFKSRVRNSDILAKVYTYNASTNPNPAQLYADAYVEYIQGRVDTIFGGCYGYYDYTDRYFKDFTYADGKCKPGFTKPRMGHTFINFRPTESNNQYNTTLKIHGAGQGFPLEMGQDSMQVSSYILADVPKSMTAFQNTDIFGAGAYGGVGMCTSPEEAAAKPDSVSAIIDLVRGQFRNIYGGSFNEGMVRRSVVNVPAGSTIRVNNLFGGGFGLDKNIPCDVYESQVNYHSEDATVNGNIYGGNNNADRTLYAHVNVSAPVWQNKATGNLATVYGAGLGEDTWAQYTEVNLTDSAKVYEVYGGGKNGKVINKESLDAWAAAVPELDLSMHGYIENGLDNDLVKTTKLGGKYNTNVHINEGATVVNYAYGGGLGDKNIPGSGDVSGTTYIDLLGGTVKKDLYAAGTTGNVYNVLRIDEHVFKIPTTGEGSFVASANAYIEGGTARNVYGGGWEGSVGYHAGAISASTANDIPGETHVIIGKTDGTDFINGLPAIERNAYGGGEGGAVFGTTNITLKKGYIGYRFFKEKNKLIHFDADTLNYIKDGTGEFAGYYQEKLHDETWKGDSINRLYDSGCIFGGGYIDNSSVDVTNVKMYGGHVRNALFGGGEIAAIGRGIINASGQDNSVRSLKGIYKAGKTNVELYEGNVHRNVFGGGRGYNNLGDGGTLYSDGYVFGQTEVHIFGGTVGTAKELALENGNVFGGGDIGYVYSAYDPGDGSVAIGQKDGKRYDDQWEGYYYKRKGGAYDENGHYVHPDDPANPETLADLAGWEMENGEYKLTEDCKVLVEPHCKVLSPVRIHNTDYAVGDYVPTDSLHWLKNKYDYNKDTETGDSLKWACLDPSGIIIYNAVFAGGNTSSGSSAVYANTTTVFGNATASIHDVYHRDFITLGTGRTGGLYGDGNLTFVDGYRGLNITNYGTDYYTIAPEITIDDYKALPEREAAYYQLKYKCIQECKDKDGTSYYPESTEHAKASTLTIDDLLTLFEGNNVILIDDGNTGKKKPNPAYWEENGVCSIYAGRLMNTIQRADFCGVFGSRMVMQGAQDRVPEIVDHTNYTINRVREVSLNQQHSKISSDLDLKPEATPAASVEDQLPTDFADQNKAVHGNYFGIYNIVNYLGALTSDVHFMADKDIRITDNLDTDTYGPEIVSYDDPDTKTGPHYKGDDFTYYNWKKKYVNERKRNNGTSLNKVALASGVYLELVSETEDAGNKKGIDLGLYEKKWGYITGVVELDLINVQPGIGGGFVYAKNIHQVGTYSKQNHTTLTALNKDAITRKDFTYNGDYVDWETSGNFVHGTQIIIDDCYNVSGKYKGKDAVPAHYWYIKGSVYVYDQYISAYTGAPNAYSESVDIPLTITAASHGTMKLLNVMPNKYAYWKDKNSNTPLVSGQKMIINDVEYHKNDVISYWDWYLLTKSEQALFEDSTYVTIAECRIGEGNSAITFPADSVLLPNEYKTLKKDNPTVYHVAKGENVPFDFVFRSSNNLGHNTGYMLTYKVNNPLDWDTWYTEYKDIANDATKAREKDLKKDSLATETENDLKVGPNNGPTYRLTSGTGGVFGQQEYKVSNIISKEVYDTFEQKVRSHVAPADQAALAAFENAYIVTSEYIKDNEHLHVGNMVSATKAGTMTGYVKPAYICTSTIPLSKTEFIYVGARMTEAEKMDYYNRFNKEGATDVEKQIAKEIQDLIMPAYYCTTAGKYGGDYYEAGKNYRGLNVWCSMSKADREKFTFNYDALDLLIDSLYSKDPETGSIRYGEGHKYQYDSADATEAAAKLNPAGYSLEKPVNYSATYNGNATTTHNGVTLEKNKEYSREDYEKLPNEKRHYAPIEVKTDSIYVVNTSLQIGNTPYAVGTIIPATTYNGLGTSDQACVTKLKFTGDQKNKTFYFCRESYEVGELTEGVSVTNAAVTGSKTGTYNNGQTVPIGLVISSDSYNGLANWQTNFTIHGIAPTETSTLYVSRESDIFDLSKEKIITVIYEYNYEESDVSGAHVTPISERHVVNIHLQFKSGIPTVEDIKAPQIVLPGTFVGIREPHVTPGAYEVTGGGWKLFEKAAEAESHVNGIEYTPTFDPLYWYQDGYYLAYYAKTYLGETYSNTVQVSVANYHDLTKVLNDTLHHYYVDNKNVKRESKIYITDKTNGATQLKQLFDLSVFNGSPADITDGLINNGPFKGHALLDGHVKGCKDLEFFLHTNVNHTGEWTPIGTDDDCFEGNLHGDGYHIDGLDKSLFYNLCGNVYNLGVTGSFKSAGIAEKEDATKDKAYMENCWINTSATSDFTGKAILGATPTKEPSRKRVVNCYYPLSKAYTASDATPLPDSAFYNGTAAYNLNGFYLYKRYNNTKTGSGTAHTFYNINNDGTLSAPQTKNYVEQNATYCSSGIDGVYANGGYVEDRFADGDFRYADGIIPEAEEARMHTDANGTYFYPIWPDDYIYFGQMLTYGWNSQRPHEDVPSHIVKSNGRLSITDESNRIYRAPAYYQSKVMNVAHFNPSVNLVAYSKPQSANDKDLKAAYPNMTAIDFYGHYDTQWSLGRVPSTSPAGMDKFYLPLLDESGLNNISNRDETPNLLVYAPTAEDNAQTYGVLTEYFTEPAYTSYYSESDDYRRVAAAPTSQVFGHLVHQGDTKLIANSDHLLVDKKDFNCPLSYTFASGKRMWYQRVPDNYVALNKGWETVSLPFTAELVSTQQKGEITHFYSGSPTIEGSDAKIGHEYWLREYKGQKEGTNPQTDGFFTAAFNYPDAAGDDKQVNNTFLWDYYYSEAEQKDANTDTYQTYYNSSRKLEAYPLLATAKPYIVGFPGKTYYEFDLSGEWTAKNTASPAPDKLDKQTVSFVSVPAITIAVSDDELTATAVNGYKFMPNYMSKKVVGYLMNSDGNSFNKAMTTTTPATPVAVATIPFRPYFVAASNNAPQNARSIIFDSDDSSFAFGDEKDPSGDGFGEGDLVISIHPHVIRATSTLRRETDVRIFNINGLVIANFTIQPGETIDTHISAGGVYIVRADGARIQKKLAVR